MPHSAKLVRFTRIFVISLALLVPLGLLFALYVNAEKRIDQANDLRHLSFQLGDELRQSSDDLTRMARTYVVTGDPRYKKRYQAILDIRDGKKPRPAEYATRVYWDLVLDDDCPPRPETTQKVSLLDLMRQSGFSNPEMDKLTVAKIRSDQLAVIEMEAMKLSETTGTEAEDKHALARTMMYDTNYHMAKAAIMRPIDDFIGMMNTRTDDAVTSAEQFALVVRIVFIGFALWMLLMFCLTYRSLRKTLGGGVEEVCEHIARIGRGDFSTSMPEEEFRTPSVMGWLWEMQCKLQAHDLERTQAEKELNDKNTELERFAYTVSHDLKSPLITIQSFAGMIEKDLDSGNLERVRRDVGRIEGAAAGMTELLDDVLLLSRIGRQMNASTVIDMNKLVEKALQQLAGPQSQSGCVVTIQQDLPPAYGDEQRIAEVVQNLVENALKYRGDTASPTIEVGWRMDGGGCTYYISDNGIGVDARYHETIFGLFNKLDNKSAGTGVGLALVRRIMDVHGGRVWIESDGVGTGSRFCFSLPAAENGPGDRNGSSNSIDSARNSGGKSGPQ